MASLIGTIRTSFDDTYWIFKFIFSVGLLYFALEYAPKLINVPEALHIFYLFLGLYFFGTGVVVMNRNINNVYPIYPGVKDILDIIKKIIGGLLSILVGAIISGSIFYFLISFTTGFFVDNSSEYMEYLRWGFYIISGLVLASFVIIPLVLYSAKGRIADAYNLSHIFKLAGDCIASSLALLLQFAIIYGLLFAIIYFFIKQVFESDIISVNFAISFVAIIMYYNSMIFFSDLYDLLPEENYQKK